MDDRLRAQVYANLQLRDTEDLIQIWRQRNLDEWEAGTFEIIESILLERLGRLPDPISEDTPKRVVQHIKEDVSPDQAIQRANQILQRVESYWQEDELENALKECKLAVEIAPEYADAHFCRGVTYEDLGRLDLAIVDYQTTVHLDPNHKNALKSISVVEKELGDKFQESKTKAHLDQALEYVYIDEPEKAVGEIDLAKQDMPDIAIAYNYLGLILQGLGELESAIGAYRNAIERNPRFYTARGNLANARMKMEEEQYYHSSDDRWDIDIPELVADNFVDEEWENLDEYPPVPGWVYMDRNAFLLSGWPSHRIRPGRTGYDPLDMDFEAAHMQGRIIRMLLNMKFRTHIPIYLLLMSSVGCIFCLPLIVITATIIAGDWTGLILSATLVLYGVVGLAVFVNIFSSLLTEKPKEAVENGSAFF
jgi:Tfp pilus assembly protein PilF